MALRTEIPREEWHSEIQQKVQFVQFALRISPVKGLYQLKTSQMDFSISPVVSCPYIWIGNDQLSSSALAGEAWYEVIICKCLEIKISCDRLAIKKKKKVATLKNERKKKNISKGYLFHLFHWWPKYLVFADVLACIHNQTISCDPHTSRLISWSCILATWTWQNRLVLHTSFSWKLSREWRPLSLQFITFSFYKIIWYCSRSVISKSIGFNCHCHNQLPNFFAHFLSELDVCLF